MYAYLKEQNELKVREHQERQQVEAKFCTTSGSHFTDSATSVGEGYHLTSRGETLRDMVRKKFSQQHTKVAPPLNLKTETSAPLLGTAPMYLTDGASEWAGPPAESGGEEKSVVELIEALAASDDEIATFELPTELVPPGFSRGIVKLAPKAAGKGATSAVEAPDSIVSGARGTEFPVKDVSGAIACDDPVRALKELCQRLHGHNDYARERDEYCLLSIRLNLDGKQAPAFRQELSFKADARAPVRLDIHRDQIVIDLHWCHARRLPVRPLKLIYELLFDADAPFPFHIAWEFANQNWKKAYRADEVLTLTTMQQCQLAAIRNEGVTQRFKVLYQGVRSASSRAKNTASIASRKINHWAERDSRIFLLRDEYLKLWCARELLGGEATSTLVASLTALMTGREALDRSTVQQKLKRLDIQLKKSLF